MGVVNGRATVLPKPEYPLEAGTVKMQGTVNVEVAIDEEGNIISATAVSGSDVLRKACEDAAFKVKFIPLVLSGFKVKVSGVIIYNFIE